MSYFRPLYWLDLCVAQKFWVSNDTGFTFGSLRGKYLINKYVSLSKSPRCARTKPNIILGIVEAILLILAQFTHHRLKPDENQISEAFAFFLFLIRITLSRDMLLVSSYIYMLSFVEYQNANGIGNRKQYCLCVSIRQEILDKRPISRNSSILVYELAKVATGICTLVN